MTGLLSIAWQAALQLKKGESIGWVLAGALVAGVVFGYTPMVEYQRAKMAQEFEEKEHAKDFAKLEAIVLRIDSNVVTEAKMVQAVSSNNQLLADAIGGSMKDYIDTSIGEVIDAVDALKEGDDYTRRLLKDNIHKQPLIINLPSPVIPTVEVAPLYADSARYKPITGMSADNEVYKAFDDDAFLDFYMSNPVEKKKGIFSRIFKRQKDST